MRVSLLAAAVLFITAASAQTPGSCEPGTAVGTLDIGDVKADVFNDGLLFYGSTGSERYVVPKAGGVAALYSASLWIGGTVGTERRVTGSVYGYYNGLPYVEYWPGPLHSGAALPDSNDCSAYDRIWIVSVQQIRDVDRGGAPTADLRDWPVGLGAPALDAAGVPIVPTSRGQTLDLAAGERPALLGEQTAFWVMNDVGNEHWSFGSPPLGIEVRVLAGAFLSPQNPTLQQATAYRFEVVNRSSGTITDLKVAVFVSGSLGNSSDDYLGTDPGRSLAFTYNADNVDAAYGSAPPAIGLDLLTGAENSVYYMNGDRNGATPANAKQADRNMRGLWQDGVPMTRGGRGYNAQGSATLWAFPDRPGDFWSEVDAYPEAGRQSIPPTVKEALITSLPVDLPSGSAHAVDAAVIYARGSDNYQSVVQLRAASDAFQGLYDAGHLFPAGVRPVASEPTRPTSGAALAVSPNPSADRAYVSFTLAAPADVRVTLVDVLGRTVRVVADGARESGEHRAEVETVGLAAGLYRIVVAFESKRASVALTVAR